MAHSCDRCDRRLTNSEPFQLATVCEPCANATEDPIDPRLVALERVAAAAERFLDHAEYCNMICERDDREIADDLRDALAALPATPAKGGER